jgi:hypothetical protein
VDRAANRISFSGTAVHLTVLASPPGGRDETFRVAGLTNPAIAVTAGARVSIEVINADPDTARDGRAQQGILRFPARRSAHAPRLQSRRHHRLTRVGRSPCTCPGHPGLTGGGQDSFGGDSDGPPFSVQALRLPGRRNGHVPLARLPSS